MSAISHRGIFDVLPIELEDIIFFFLDYPSAIFFAATNKYFRHRIDAMTLVPDYEKETFVQAAQYTLSQHRPTEIGPGGHACFRCFKVKPYSVFSLSQVIRKRAKGYDDETKRFCMPCGVDKKIISPGDLIVPTNGRTLLMCRHCMALKDGRFCATCQVCQDHEHTRGFATGEDCGRCGSRISGIQRLGKSCGDGDRR